MFGFMKKHGEKEREEKERKKLEKEEKKKREKTERKDKKHPGKHVPTAEELAQLEQARSRLNKQSSDVIRSSRSANGGQVSASESLDSIGSISRDDSSEGLSFTNNPHMDYSRSGKVPPPTRPKPKKGILKGKSNYGPEIPNHGVRGNLDDTVTVLENTRVNELMEPSADDDDENDADDAVEMREGNERRTHSVKSLIANMENTSPEGDYNFSKRNHNSLSPPTINVEGAATEDEASASEPAEKTYDNVDLQLPNLAPPRSLQPRNISLKRQPAGDFGFSLRKGTVLERALDDDTERKRIVIFAEPGPRSNHTGLLPGDRLIEVNGSNVENCTREEIIDLIRGSSAAVQLKVQPIPELSELSVRSGLEGEDVGLGEQNVQQGTLKRSGSMRYKSKGAKSEDEVATERAWLSAERVWLVHKGGFAASRLLKPAEGVEGLPEGKCKVKLDHGGELLEVDEGDVEKMNPPQFDRVEDLTTLRHLNESSILHTLRQRYGSNLIHSYAGRSLLIVNPMHPLSIYSEKVIQMFRGCKPEDMPPHIYATAQIAYRNLLNTRRDQSIVFTGRSGSGKTTNLRHLLHYYMVAAGAVNKVLTIEKLNAVFTLLDAFGNSRTIMNTSASRYTQITSLDIDHAGQIASASIQVMMLEKTRITRRPEGEPTFHVFYQLLAGIDSQLRKDLQLENLNEPNLFMTPLQRAEDRQKASQAWSKIHHSLTCLGITEVESKAIYAVLAAIYHLGAAGTMKGPNNKYQFARPAAAQRAATVLGTTLEELARTIFNPSPNQLQARGSFRGAQDKPSTPEKKDSLSGLEALEGFVIGLYSEVFYALISLINRSLSSNCRSVASIVILDSPGFQNPASCGRQTGATFEDLCHNYVQERLQLMYHETVFTHQQDLYSQENIDCDFEPLTNSPASLVTLLDKPSQQSLVRSPNRDLKDDQRGLLWLLDEEAILPGSSDEIFLKKLHQIHGQSEKQSEDETDEGDAVLKKGSQANSFVLNHFQGTSPVQYTTKGWLRSSRENPIAIGVNVFLQESKKEEIGLLFSSVRGPGSSLGVMTGMESTSSLRRASSIRRTCNTGTANLKRKSLCLQTKFQTDSVMETVRRTRIHFVHCLLPQHNAGLCDLRATLTPNKANPEDIMLNVPLVRAQVRGAEIVEAIRLHRQGYPEHMQFTDFRQRFEILVPSESKPAAPFVDDKQATERVLQSLEVDRSTFRLGLSQVFLRAGGLAQLEDNREEKIGGTIIKLQSLCRGQLARQRLKRLKLQHLAVSCIQRNVRKFMAIRNWSWWRLYSKIQPLLDVHRTEEELRSKDVELDQLKMKFEKIEKERNEFKIAVDKLETKLSEITADLTEEHTTSSHASEMLESETAERIRLERDLHDVQSKFSVLQRRFEQTEMDLMHTRMLAASIDEELEDDDEGGDSVYRERYERLKKEMIYTKKKLQEQHEEELEEKEKAKKQLERKLAEARTDSEEQQRQVGNHKRKSQRLAQEAADMKRHLEEQVTRNAELEKKQRKFDLELHKVNEMMKQEKSLKEKSARERENIASEKFTIEQDLKNLKLDYELQSEKVVRLGVELDDLSSVSQDSTELMQLKRLKNELERKVQDQEEELDEQAGTIQQLEQAKLRLEMSQENNRQQHSKELEDKDQEIEETRASAQKKLKVLESQIEEEYEEKQSALREKRELERKLQDVGDVGPVRDRDMEKRLRRDLRRTKALLEDAQLMLQKQKEGAGNRTTIRQLRNQLEDSEYATAAAIKARKSVEMELQETQQHLEDITRTKQEAEERCMLLGREKNDLASHLEDSEEEYAELLKKYKAAVQQQSIDYLAINDQSKQIEELQRENQLLREQVMTLQSQVEFSNSNTVDKQVVVRLEAKIRELEAKHDLEHTTRSRAETQHSRTKENLEALSEERDRLQLSEQKQQEVAKRLQRQLRDLREEYSEVQVKEAEASQRKHDLEKKVESLESEYEQCQSDLRLAFKRISDLQAVIEEDIGSDEESDLDSDYALDSEGESDDMDMSDLVSRRSNMSARGSMSSSVEGSVASRKSVNGLS